MNDPHVEALHFDFISEVPSDNFDKAAPLVTDLGPFGVELRAGKLQARPKSHFPNEESAKAAIEPFLRAWESAALLSEGRFRIRFIYRKADIIDRDPDPGVVSLKARASATVITTDNAMLVRSMNEFPAPDPNFQPSSLTDELIERLKQYQDKRMPLTSFAYWLLTKLEKEYGNRDTAREKLQIGTGILDNLGKLSSSTDPKYGRKAKGQGPTVLSPAELRWLDATVYRLIFRVGEINTGSALSKITMQGLPKI